MNVIEKESLRLIDQHLKRITTGHLRILLPTSAEKSYGDTQEKANVIQVRNYNFFSRLMLKGDIGLGESWLDNEWSSDDLAGALKVFLHNHALSVKDGLPLGILGRLQYELQHAFGRYIKTDNPSKQMSYDLNDEFFQLYLDEKTMLSSSAIFESEADTLSEAQLRKIQKVIELSDIDSNHHVLDIGCGRGGFMIELAKTCGCRVTGTTTSEEEFRFARARIQAEGLTDQVRVELCNANEISGMFDRIISLESIDTIGRIDYNAFYTACNKLLKPGGRLIQQIVTVPDHSFKKHCRYPTWLHKNVFPGGMIPSLSELSDIITHSSSLTIETLNSIGDHYGETLRRWKKSFTSNSKALVKLGFDGSFQRKWIYLITYCEAAFESGCMNNHHMILTKPESAE